MFKHYFFGLILACFFTSCYEVPVLIPELAIPDSERVVLLEDLTGVQCPNCPKGSATIEGMLEIFDENLAVIGIHGRLQAAPLPESKYDFRTPFAENLEQYHRPFLGKPSAVINRMTFAGEFFKAVDLVDLWPSYVQSELSEPPLIDLFALSSYDSASRKLTIDFTMIPKIDIPDPVKLSIFLTESHIIDIQETIGSIIEDFEHNHVLRTMLTQFDGDPLGVLKDGVPLKRTYTYTVPDEFKAENMEIVGALTDGSISGGIVYQAAKRKLIE